MVLNDRQINFLNLFYGINLYCLKNDAVIFKNLKKEKIVSSQIPPSLLDEFLNKIYQKKFTLMQLIQDLPILIG